MTVSLLLISFQYDDLSVRQQICYFLTKSYSNILIEKKINRSGEALSLQRMSSTMPRISEENEETVDIETESMTSGENRFPAMETDAEISENK